MKNKPLTINTKLDQNTGKLYHSMNLGGKGVAIITTTMGDFSMVITDDTRFTYHPEPHWITHDRTRTLKSAFSMLTDEDQLHLRRTLPLIGFQVEDFRLTQLPEIAFTNLGILIGDAIIEERGCLYAFYNLLQFARANDQTWNLTVNRFVTAINR